MASTNTNALQALAAVEGVPCPSWVINSKTGKRNYCEVGPAGHYGTCHGDRSQAEYKQLLEATRS